MSRRAGHLRPEGWILWHKAVGKAGGIPAVNDIVIAIQRKRIQPALIWIIIKIAPNHIEDFPSIAWFCSHISSVCFCAERILKGFACVFPTLTSPLTQHRSAHSSELLLGTWDRCMFEQSWESKKKGHSPTYFKEHFFKQIVYWAASVLGCGRQDLLLSLLQCGDSVVAPPNMGS